MVGEGQETMVLVKSAGSVILRLYHDYQGANIMADGQTTGQCIQE